MAGFFGLGSLIPHSRPPLLMRLVGGFICTYLAPHRQPVFVDVCFVKVALGLPPLTPSTSLLLHPVNNSMTLLISIILFQALPLFLVTLSHICPHAVLAIIPQSVFALTILAKLTLIFPLFAFGTAFLPHAINGPMAFPIYEVFFHRSPDSHVTSVAILTVALFAPNFQSVLAATILTELTLTF